MTYFPETLRGRIHRILTQATSPLTTVDLAGRADTTRAQAARALRRLEDDGTAVRQLGDGGCYSWTATDSSTKRTR